MAQNVLLNGDFESWDDGNTPTGWTHVENITQEDTAVHDGTYSAKHVGGIKDLGQTVNVTPGQTYKFTVWYNVKVAGNHTARLWCALKSADGTSDLDNTPEAIRMHSYFDAGNGDEWLKYEAIITIPADLPQLYYELRTYDGTTIYWDDLIVEPYTVDLTAPNSGNYQNDGDTVNITWTSTGVDSVLLYVRMEGLAEPFLITEESAILASVGMFDLPIPGGAEEGNYKFIVVDKDSQTAADSSDNFIFIKDVVFRGLDNYPFSPENGAVGVPTDLFTGRLEMYFHERVQVGTGNIYLKKFSDNSVVETFDVTNSSQVAVDIEKGYNVYIFISSNLDSDTKYYVEVDAGAITDRAGEPNSFAGFTGNSTWVFTTGAGDSFMSIHDIQYTTDPSGDSPHNGEIVKTKGIIMAKSSSGYFIQEAAGNWSGIYVYDTDSVNDVAVGDKVVVAGMVDEHNNMTQLKDIHFRTVLNSGNTLHDATTVTLDQIGEPYESVLIMVETVSCSNPDMGHGEWEISDGTNTGVIDDLLFACTPTQDEQFTSITGVLNYSFNDFKIEPRDAADIVAISTKIRNVNDAGLIVVPNPVANEIKISANSAIADVQVINLVGEVMNVETVGVTGQISVAVGDLAKGLYLVMVTFTDGTVKTQKIIKR